MLGRLRSRPGLHEAAVLLVLVGLLCAARLVMPEFLQPRSQLLLSRSLWETAIPAFGMTLMILAGGIDLSVGGSMALAVVAFGMTHAAGAGLPGCAIACLLTGTLCGVLNGLLTAGARIHPLIATLATMAAFRGIAEGLSQGKSWSGFGAEWSQLSRGSWLGLPYGLVGTLVLAAATGGLLLLTPWGTMIRACGYNPVAARFSGIPVRWIQFWLHVWCGTLSGVAALLYVSRFDTASAEAGLNLELDVITAVVLGGVSIHGGRGTALGTFLGLLLIHETRLFISRYWRIDELRFIATGVLLILAVMFSQAARGRQDGTTGADS